MKLAKLLIIYLITSGIFLNANPPRQKTYGLNANRLILGLISGSLAVGAGHLSVDAYKYIKKHKSASERTQKLIAFLHEIYLSKNNIKRNDSLLGSISGLRDNTKERNQISDDLCVKSGIASLCFGLISFYLLTSGNPIEVVVSENTH